MSLQLKHASVGTRVQFGIRNTRDGGEDLTWIKVRDDNTFILRATVIIGSFDADEPKNTSRDRRRNGNNYYLHSNIHQWLNSSGRDWYSPQHQADECPYLDGSRMPGFLDWFNPSERSALMPYRFPIQVPVGSKKEFGKTQEIEANVWLPSASNLGFMSGEDSVEDAEYVFPESIRVDLIQFARYGGIMTRSPLP